MFACEQKAEAEKISSDDHSHDTLNCSWRQRSASQGLFSCFGYGSVGLLEFFSFYMLSTRSFDTCLCDP